MHTKNTNTHTPREASRRAMYRAILDGRYVTARFGTDSVRFRKYLSDDGRREFCREIAICAKMAEVSARGPVPFIAD